MVGRPAKQQETTNIRIGTDTHRTVVNVAAALRLKRGLRTTPTIDEVIKESIVRLASAELSGDGASVEACHQ